MLFRFFFYSECLRVADVKQRHNRSMSHTNPA
ncbi:UNVERIFIED_ORG: hypothetical protein M2414_001562 [Rahnella aquatilis]